MIDDITVGYTQEQWDRLKALYPNIYKDIPIDQLYIKCEGCGDSSRCIDNGDACKKCGMRFDKMSSW